MIGFFLFVSFYGSDYVQEKINPEDYYKEKLSFSIKKKEWYEKETDECYRQLMYLVKNRNKEIKIYMADGISNDGAIKLWEDDLELTRKLCSMSDDGVQEFNERILFYKDKLKLISKN